jgi:hypothetical protein
VRWYLRFLEDIQKTADGAGRHSNIPERKEILRLLDLETEGLRKARWLLQSLPQTFPRYEGISN